MNKEKIITIVLLLFAFSCTPYIAPKPEKPQLQVEVAPAAAVVVSTPEPQRKVNLTYIDTLNRGKEITLNDSVQKPAASKSGNVLTTTVQSEQSGRFRIQVLASNQAERLKEEKKKFDKQLSIISTVAFEAPYYKLYAGDFSQRSDADATLQKIKKLGYPDAWVASVKVLPKQ
jgi:hypothetical protein